ncbi:unnamed protein product [Lampetra planeri]
MEALVYHGIDKRGSQVRTVSGSVKRGAGQAQLRTVQPQPASSQEASKGPGSASLSQHPTPLTCEAEPRRTKVTWTQQAEMRPLLPPAAAASSRSADLCPRRILVRGSRRTAFSACVECDVERFKGVREL